MNEHDRDFGVEIQVLSKIVAVLEPIDELSRAKVLGAVALLHGQYDVAQRCLELVRELGARK